MSFNGKMHTNRVKTGETTIRIVLPKDPKKKESTQTATAPLESVLSTPAPKLDEMNQESVAYRQIQIFMKNHSFHVIVF